MNEEEPFHRGTDHRDDQGAGGRDAGALFTRVGMQLEAYCSAIGIVLLANLPLAEREAYLAGGPFVALTHRTIVDPAMLREELAAARLRGFAIDDEEVAPNLRCMAVSPHTTDGRVLAAISVLQALPSRKRLDDGPLLASLTETARAIERQAFGAR